jgi:hypothetical protein
VLRAADTCRVPVLTKLRAITASAAVLLAVTVVGLFATGQIDTAADDLLELVAALLAAMSCGLAAAGSRGRLRFGWAALAGACGAWAIGEGIWSGYELGLHQETPFPSAADIGFLLFPLGAMAALLAFPARANGSDRRRMTFDGLATATAVTLISWTSTLGVVFSQSTGSVLATSVGLAYPISDMALLVVCVLVLSRATGRRVPLALVAGGLALMAVADSAFAYTTAKGTYTTGSLLDLGWFAAFFLLALAPIMPGALDRKTHGATESVAGSLLTYVPLTVAVVVETARYASGRSPGAFESVLCVVLMALVLSRQALTSRDNKQLALRLTQRERELRHQAFHDGLTGWPTEPCTSIA